MVYLEHNQIASSVNGKPLVSKTRTESSSLSLAAIGDSSKGQGHKALTFVMVVRVHHHLLGEYGRVTPSGSKDVTPL